MGSKSLLPSNMEPGGGISGSEGISMERLTSTQNPLIKELSLLHERKGRQEAGCFLVEGVRLVREAFRSGAPVVRLLADDEGMPILSGLLQKYSGPEPLWVSAGILEKLSDTKSPQGIMAVVRLPDAGNPMTRLAHAGAPTVRLAHAETPLERLAHAGAPSVRLAHAETPLEGLAHTGAPSAGISPVLSFRRILVLERVQDPGNVGTMIRTADACGFDMVVLSADSADPWQPKALRSSMGSIWHLSVTVADDLLPIVDAAAGAGLSAYAAHPRNAAASWDTQLADHVMLVIGNEAGGISTDMLERVSGTVRIPMEGLAESLNAAAAASILMYESLRQRHASVIHALTAE